MTITIGGNWKSQVTTVADAVDRLTALGKAARQHSSLTTFIAVPSALLYPLSQYDFSPIKLASQDMHYTEKGAFTGVTSVLTLNDLQIEYVLIGHSERRIIFRETNEELNQKVLLALKHNKQIVFCIGETAKERASGQVEAVLSTQLSVGLQNVTDLSSICIAYEPVWAINNKYLNPDSEIKAASPEEAQKTHAFIRGWVRDHYSAAVANNMSILYGGSMKGSNAQALLSMPDINGGLIGGASLAAELLDPVLQIADQQ